MGMVAPCLVVVWIDEHIAPRKILIIFVIPFPGPAIKPSSVTCPHPSDGARCSPLPQKSSVAGARPLTGVGAGSHIAFGARDLLPSPPSGQIWKSPSRKMEK